MARHITPAFCFVVAAALLCAVSRAAEQCEAGAQDPASDSNPRFDVRELYAPGHFGNSYEVMGEYEMRRYLAEAKHWGFNRYGDWMDAADCSDPFGDGRLILFGRAIWERKKQNFRSARDAGLECDLILTPNHVYLDQCRPELLAVKSKLIFGQLICPSIPAARSIILKNHENLFADLAAAGVRLKSVTSFAYDFGGCDCDKCRPWIVTYAKLMRDIHDLARRHHADVELNLCSWHWTKDDYRLLADWADREAPGLIAGIIGHIKYDETTLVDPLMPRDCRRRAFVHIGYADKAKPADLYGHYGPVVAPARMPRTVNDLCASGTTGIAAYSEGVFDDVNKALLAGLSSGRFRTADEVLRAYARRYFDADEEQAEQWAQWLAAWGHPFDLDPDKMAGQLSKLTLNGGDNWRQRQWVLKTELFRLHKIIADGKQWTPDRLESVQHFWQVQEQIHRGLWGLAAPRSVFARGVVPPSWYQSWAEQTRTNNTAPLEDER